MRFLILLLFIGTFVGCEPEFGFETNLEELETVSFTISGGTSGSTLPDINVNNLIDGNTYSIHTDDVCNNEVLNFIGMTLPRKHSVIRNFTGRRKLSILSPRANKE